MFKVLCCLALLGVAAVRSQALFDDLTLCLTDGPEGCLENRLERALDRAQNIQDLKITRDLHVVRLVQNQIPENEVADSFLSKLERYLYDHGLKLEFPKELSESAPRQITDNLPNELIVPLAESDESEGRSRGYMKKVILPFLIGLKFKTTAVIPLAMALIALKTWKALTLGLLSIVLSGAMIIFRLTKPKLQHYEVYYPPPHPPTHHHFVDHTYDHHYAARSDDMAYSAHTS